MRRVAGAAAVVALAMAMTGCTMTNNPTLEEAREQTDAALQRIADEIPGSTIEVGSRAIPYAGCGEGRYNYIARWAVYPPPGFDGKEFVEELPRRLGGEFAVAESVAVSFPIVALDHGDGIALQVMVLDDDGVEVVDLSGVSPCAEGELPG